MLKTRIFNWVVSILFVMISFMASSSAFSGKAILQITPSSTNPITISPTGSSYLTYTVTNHTTGHVVNNFTFDPYYNLTGNPLSLSIANNNCAGQTLQVGQSCTFQLNIQGTGQPTNVILSPEVCIYNSRSPALCSTTIESNRVNVVVTSGSPILVAAGTNLADITNTLLAQSVDGGMNWAVQSISGIPFGVGASFSQTSCTGSGATAFCIAAGFDENALEPVLVQTNNGGTNWSFVSSIPELQFSGVQAAACLGGNTCIAAGGDLGGVPADNIPPLIVQNTTNSPTGWSIAPIANNNIPDGAFLGISCTGTGSTSLCTAAGAEYTAGTDRDAILVQSIGGGIWNFVSIPGITANDGTLFNTTSCTGSGSSALCIAAGEIAGSNNLLLAQALNGGTSWNLVNSIAGLPSTPSFARTSCTGSGATAICVAAGSTQIPIVPALVQTTNGGAGWDVVSVPGVPANGGFFGVSCTGSGSTALCVAGGQDQTADPGTENNGAPLLAQSTNGGATWNLVTVPGLTQLGIFSSVFCVGSGATATCIAVGQDTSLNPTTAPYEGPPLLVQTLNGGATWNVVTVTGAPTSGKYFGAGGSMGSQIMKKSYGARKALEKVLHQ